MPQQFDVYWEGLLPAGSRDVWEAITRHADGYLWKIDYEPWVGGAERGLTAGGGTVTAWDPPRHFATRTRPEAERDGPNALDYVLEERDGGTYLRYVHHGTFPDEGFDDLLDQCRRHTDLYNSSLGQYAAHFAGRQAAYVACEGPAASARDGLARMRRALGVPDDAAAGDGVVLSPGPGLAPIEGTVDYAAAPFLGVRSADALYRFYGLDHWDMPVRIAHHLFAPGVDRDAAQTAWAAWLTATFASATVA